jgi:hypothetical protein
MPLAVVVGLKAPHEPLEQVTDQLTPENSSSLETTALTETLVLAASVSGGPTNVTDLGCPLSEPQALRHRRAAPAAAVQNDRVIIDYPLDQLQGESFF